MRLAYFFGGGVRWPGFSERQLTAAKFTGRFRRSPVSGIAVKLFRYSPTQFIRRSALRFACVPDFLAKA